MGLENGSSKSSCNRRRFSCPLCELEQGSKDHRHEHQPHVEEKIFTDDELVALIDPILTMDDYSRDGFIDYPEFVRAQQKAAANSAQEQQQNQQQQIQQQQHQPPQEQHQQHQQPPQPQHHQQHHQPQYQP